MEDDDLAQIRARRMAEMRQQQGGPATGGAPAGAEAAAKQQEQRQAMEDMKNGILNQVLSQEARARLSTIKLAKAEKGARIEATILQMAQSGQIQSRLSEAELIGLLERFSEAPGMGGNKTTVKFDRRRAALDSDSD